MTGLNYVNVADEATYGTPPATGWRGVKAADDGHKVNVLTLPSTGIVYGQQGPFSQGRRAVERDAAGTIKADLASNGLGFLLRAVFGSAVLSTPVDATAARQMLFTTTGAASTHSIATQIQREKKGGGGDFETYQGGQVTEFRMMQALAPSGGGVSPEAKTKVEFDLIYQKRNTVLAQKLPTYVNPDIEFSVGECTLEVGPADGSLSDECLNKFEFKLPTGLDTDAQCINASLIKDKATRGELPVPTLALGWDYKDDTYAQAYYNGTIMQFRATWTPTAAEGDVFEIEDGINPSVVLDIPAFQFTGDTAQMAESAKTTQDLPADILWNGTDPMVSLTVITSDTAF